MSVHREWSEVASSVDAVVVVFFGLLLLLLLFFAFAFKPYKHTAAITKAHNTILLGIAMQKQYTLAVFMHPLNSPSEFCLAADT